MVGVGVVRLILDFDYMCFESSTPPYCLLLLCHKMDGWSRPRRGPPPPLYGQPGHRKTVFKDFPFQLQCKKIISGLMLGYAQIHFNQKKKCIVIFPVNCVLADTIVQTTKSFYFVLQLLSGFSSVSKFLSLRIQYPKFLCIQRLVLVINRSLSEKIFCGVSNSIEWYQTKLTKGFHH